MASEETKAKVDITFELQEYKIDLASFESADLTEIIVPMGVLFLGQEAQTVHVRSISFE